MVHFGALMWSISALAFAIVIAWLAITLVAQIAPLRRKISPKDLFRLIPAWTFFAPNPGIRDYHLVWREMNLDGSLWKNVPISVPRPKFACVWHPQKRTKKILNDAVQAFHTLKQHQGYSQDQLQLTIPYLLLLRHSQATLGQTRAGQGQFAVVASWGHDDPLLELSFLSEIHDVS